MNKERVDVRVEAEFLEELDMLAERQGLSRSAAIREAIIAYVMEKKDGWNSTRFEVNIPSRIAERLHRQVRNGDATDPQAAIIMAVDVWLKDREEYCLTRRDLLDEKVAENVRSDEGMRKLEDRAKDLGRR